MRDAARASEERIDKYFVDLSFREDLYAAIKAYAGRGEALEGEEARLLEYELRDYRRNGFELPEGERARVRELSDELVSLGVEFQKNISEWDDGILVTREELSDLPDAFIESLRTEEVDGRRATGSRWTTRSSSRSWGRRGRRSCGGSCSRRSR